MFRCLPLLLLTTPACASEPERELWFELDDGTGERSNSFLFDLAAEPLPRSERIRITGRAIDSDHHEETVRWLELVEASVESIETLSCDVALPICDGMYCRLDISLPRPGACVLLVRAASDGEAATGCLDIAVCDGWEDPRCAGVSTSRADCEERL